MKTAIYLVITCLISTGCFMATTNMENPFPAFGAGFGIWLLFIWGYNKRSRKAAQRKFQEHMFQQHMRSILHNPRY
jgi:hypothetical protein